jgi:Fe-S-cluster containining protein
MKKEYKSIKINLTTVTTDTPIANVACKSCTYCCEVLTHFLTPEEISYGLYPLSLISPEESVLQEFSDAGPIVTLFKNKNGGCAMLVDKKCTIYEYRPKSCRQFDCRAGHHSKIPNLADNNE